MMSSPWQGIIMFSVMVFTMTKESPLPDLSSENFALLDLCSFLDGTKAPVTHLCFDPKQYALPLPRSSLPLSKHKPCLPLKRDFMRAAHVMGNPVGTTGSRGGAACDVKSIRLRYSCFCCHGSCNYSDSPKFRIDSLVGNHKNAQKNGRKKGRRRHVRQDGTCPFTFTVKWDDFGFYVNLNRCCGKGQHKFHPKEVDISILPLIRGHTGAPSSGCLTRITGDEQFFYKHPV